MNLRQQIAVVCLNVAMLVELSVSICWSNADPDYFTTLFCKYFFTMLVPTLIAARIAVKRLGSGDEPLVAAEYSASSGIVEER